MQHTIFWRGVIAACVVGATLFSVGAAQTVPSPPADHIALAEAFTAALNSHDVDALLALFTEEDSGPTVNADRYAWQKYEIRLWAEQQVAGGIRVTGYDYQVTEHGVAWQAAVSREDWRLVLGVDTVPLTNSIWVHEGKIADFTSTLNDPRDADVLRGFWRPSSTPDYRTDL